MSTRDMVSTFRSCSSAFLSVSCLIALLSVNAAFGQGSTSAKAAGTSGSPMPVEDMVQDRYGPGVTLTRWVGPDGSRPITHAEWMAQTGERGSAEITLVWESPRWGGRNGETGFCIIVDSSLYAQVQSSVDQYALDLTGEGYDVETYTMSGGTEVDVRTFLQGRYALGMEGCVLIGDLPVPWYEVASDNPPSRDEFPIDLYYMDMNGTFIDSDENGKYDSHIGDVTPEIWVGRLTASPLTMGGSEEVSLLIDYFIKNHAYRSGFMPVSSRALVYIDDDWAGSAA